jgi:hypothetical protein
MPDKIDSAVRAPTPLILISWRKVAFFGGGKAKQHMRIFADGQMRQQHHLFAIRWQVVKGAHRNIDFVAHALTIDQQLWGIFSRVFLRCGLS